jgi:mannose-6-phosphate isomerase-like protein (cupin superfamily)/SAM-dependent methyltransferase
MAHFELPPGHTSAAVSHRTVEEIWFLLSGRGEIWRSTDGHEDVVAVEAGTCLTIPLGTRFQFRSFGDEPLAAIGVTMPPWPGDGEATVVEGKGNRPCRSDEQVKSRPAPVMGLQSSSMGDSTHYVIRGGIAGRERLRMLGRVMHASTSSLFDRLGLHDGQLCLDVGCGGGDATLELARRVAPQGQAIGVDIDMTKLDLARAEAAELGIRNVRFERLDIRESSMGERFDVVYARFLLTHLDSPASAVDAFRRHLREGGVVAVEDIDFSGYFTYPASAALRRYQELYCATVTKRGGDPNIGPRLPGLLARCGFQDIGVSVVQPVALQGEAKLINPLTMENIADAVLQDGLATREEVDGIVRELYEFAADPGTLAGTPRVVQAWARLPAA